MKKVHELRQAIGTATDELVGLAGDPVKFAAKEAELEQMEGELKRTLAAQERSAKLARPAGSENGDGAVVDAGFARDAFVTREHPEKKDFDTYLRRARAASGMAMDNARHFRSLGEQLQAIQQFAMTRGSNCDSRLMRAPTGAGEVDPTGGGFLVQTDFANAIFMLAHDMGEILGRVGKIPISEKSNGLKIPGVDENSRATGSRWGGVQSYWLDEGTAANPTKPKFRIIEFDLKKLMSIMYVTDELLQDSTALTAIAGSAFSEEVMFMTEDSVYEGTGAGMPLGVINSPALVQVAKQNGQASATIVKENIDGMWSRCWGRSRKNAVWFINQDCEPQLNQLNQGVGTGGQLVYLPPGGLSGAPYATLYGRPLVSVEYAAALGTPGDILLADLSQYTLVDKNGVQAATSMHVAFLTDQMVFRITYRVDGRPMLTQPITPFKGSLTKSPFVALSQR